MSTLAIQKAEILAKIRKETIEEVIRRFGLERLERLPNLSKHICSLRDTSFLETGVCDGLAYVRTLDGLIFYSYLSKANHRRAYQFISDVLPSQVSEDTFLACLDVVQRYTTNFTWPPQAVQPPKDGTIVECGAYLGHKTIRFAKELTPIEMIPENVSILHRNIAENGLSKQIAVIETGIWNSSGEIEVRGKGRQRNTLLNNLGKLRDKTEILCKVDTLDNVLDAWNININSIDLLFITINGAEVEALQGLNRWRTCVKSFFVAAPYSREGKSNSDLCREWFSAHQIEVLEDLNPNRVIAKHSE